MSVFGLYSQYYNLLYRDKDYLTEAKYINQLIQEYLPCAKSILELGCGTGIHAGYLAEMGFSVTGIDMSEQMLDQARAHRISLASEVSERVDFGHGDVRHFRAGKTFDVVISLFHVFSYQTSNQDLQAAFETAASHLNPGGLLIFDYWYGPAVLTQLPEVRVKRLEDDRLRVLRIAEPELFATENRVVVNYSILMESKEDEHLERISESHNMRYLFIPEIETISNQWFHNVAHYAWETHHAPNIGDWAGVSIMKRKV